MLLLFLDDIIQKLLIVCMIEIIVVFIDGMEVEVDFVIFCIGYKYSFLFFQEGLISMENERVILFYKYMVYIDYFNLIFVGILKQWNYFL